MSVICLKLLSGDELVGNLIEETETGIIIGEVASIYMVPGSDPSKMSMGLIPFLPYSEDSKFYISSSVIVINHKPSVDLLNNYNRLFGSGIQIAQSL